MKRIGLLGGMSWESSAEYYRLVNEATRQRLGGLHSADCLLRSVDFVDVEQLQRAGSWEQAGALLAGEARALVRAGAELLMLCTNTMHKVADAIAGAVDVPFVHIATRRPTPSVPRVSAASVYWRPPTRWSTTSTSVGCASSTGSTCSCPRQPTDGSCTTSSTTSSAWVSWRPSRARSTAESCASSPGAAPRASFSAAPRSTCSSRRTTRAYRSSIPPACTPNAPSTSRSEARSSVGEPDGRHRASPRLR